MLTEVFGMEWYKVHDEAEQLEHAVSADFEKKLLDKLGNEDSCPHGNRMGTDRPKDRRERGSIPLDEAVDGRSVLVQSVFERDRNLLEYLDGLGIRPGVLVKMLAHNYDETFTLRVEETNVQLGRLAAGRIWVTAR